MIKEVEEKGKFRRVSYQMVMAFLIAEFFMMQRIINSIGKEFLSPWGLAIPLSVWILYFQIVAWEKKNRKALVLKRVGLITSEIVAEGDR